MVKWALYSLHPHTGDIDYTGPTPLVLTFSAGFTVGDEQCIAVSVIDDDLIEDEETFDINLIASPTDAAAVIFNGTDVTTFSIVQDPNDSIYAILTLFLILSNLAHAPIAN